jgi:membrane protein YqaA with SNARE-associated domain
MKDFSESLLGSIGIYGASMIISFIAGLVPILSIEVFLGLATALLKPSYPAIVLCCALAAVGHQIAKTITYYAGVGALERGRMKKKLDKVRPKLEKWNKAPKLVLALSGTIGLPPLYILCFIAEPLMKITIVPYTLIVMSTRFVRFAVVMVAIPLLF